MRPRPIITRHIIIIGFLVWITVVTSGCIPAAFGVAGASAGYDAGKEDALLGDLVVTNTVKAKFFDHKLLKTLDITVDTKEGVLTLFGIVPDEDAQQQAVRRSIS